MKKLPFRLLLFILIPFILLEIFLRVNSAVGDFYRNKTDLYYDILKTDGYNICFIGTSRVAAAINPEYISVQDSYKSFNMGRGYTTGMIHYLGLYSAIKKNPDCLKNSIVFIESPNGFCSYYYSWENNWVNEDGPFQIVPYFMPKTFAKYLRYSKSSLSTKSLVTIYYCSYTVRYLAFFKELLGRNTLSDILNKTGITNTNSKEEGSVDVMTERGGIKTDSTSILSAREYAKSYYGNLSSKIPNLTIEDWEESVFNDIRVLVEQSGAKLMMFEVPLSSIQKDAFEADKLNESIESFTNYREKYNIPLLQPTLTTTDKDFPDLWHLSYQKGKEFSQLLSIEIDSYIQNDKN